MTASRRNRLTAARPTFVHAIALLSGVFAAAADARPTGSTAIDVVLVAVSAATVTWAAASAPWWGVAVACGTAAAFSSSATGITIAVIALALAFFLGARDGDVPWGRSLATLLAVQAFARLGNIAFLGLSAIVSCTALIVLFILGVRRRPRAVRRWAYLSLIVAGGVVAIAIIGLFVAALVARAPLREGNKHARAGLDALNRGDIRAAASAFAAARTSFHDTYDDLTAPWSQPARLLPIVSQNRAAAIGVSGEGADAMGVAADALQHVDPDSLRVVDGKLDLDAVRALVQPFTDLNIAIDSMQRAIAGADSPWLITPLDHRLADLDDDLVKNKVRAENALLAVQLAPAILGGDAPRHYFIAFTTSAEARGGGGFMGNYAELTIDDGRLELSDFGRHSDLETAGPDPTHKKLTGPEEFLKRWGKFLDVQADGTVGPDAWAQITMSPDFPTTAQVIQQLYPQSGGPKVDGVFEMNPDALASLVSLTGPLDVEGAATPLTRKNLAEFILRDQYEITTKDARVELLDVIAKTAVDKLLSGSLPPPAELAKLFGPVSQVGGLNAWSADPREEALFERVGMARRFPILEGGDGVALTVDNAGGNKLDAYLQVTVNYSVTRDASGHADGTLVARLTNNAPPEGLPPYVSGNRRGLPEATNRAYVSIYTGLEATSITDDGVASTADFGRAFGWNVASTYVEIAPGETKTLVLTVAGSLSADFSVTTWKQAMALPCEITVKDLSP